ncbi:serine/threonine protein phosphatase, partial [bacterium]
AGPSPSTSSSTPCLRSPLPSSAGGTPTPSASTTCASWSRRSGRRRRPPAWPSPCPGSWTTPASSTSSSSTTSR